MGEESQPNAGVVRGEEEPETRFLPSTSVYFRKVQPEYIEPGNSRAVTFQSPSEINIENIETFILFFQEVTITEPELVKRNLEWLRNFDIKVT